MISIILGTRPEIIKMAPVIRACIKNGIPYSVLHTGQHYSYEMDRIFFEELELPEPGHNLDAGSGSHAEQTAKILTGIEKVLLSSPPDIVLVQGDTNTVLAGALAATKLHIPVGHVEAGLRSFDRSMPEEINRIVADHISDYLFAPTGQSKEYLLKEGIDEMKITVTGNTIVDAVYENREIRKRQPKVTGRTGAAAREYFLVTAHRAENVDSRDGLAGITKALSSIRQAYDIPVLFPMHPRTQKMMNQFGIDARDITVTPPAGYLEFLDLEAHARLILTDSGGVQEEACILGVPCVTLRTSTERPETVDCGANMLAGTDPGAIGTAVSTMISAERTWNNPYGDGHAGERIARFCAELS